MYDQYLHGLIGRGVRGVTGLPNMLDWTAYETIYNWSGNVVTVRPESWHTFVDLAGEGYLVFANAFSSTVIGADLKITVDGQSFIINKAFTPARNGNILLNPIYFKQSIKIETYNSSPSASYNFGVSYTLLLKQQEPSENKTFLQAGSINQYYNVTNSASYTDVVNITGSGYLLGAIFTPRYYTNTADMLARIIIDSITIMDRIVYQLGAYDNKDCIYVGPIRFENQLVVQHRLSTGGEAYGLTRAWVLLD